MTWVQNVLRPGLTSGANGVPEPTTFALHRIHAAGARP